MGEKAHISKKISVNLHINRAFSCQSNRWIQMDLVGPTMHLQELGRVFFLYIRKYNMICIWKGRLLRGGFIIGSLWKAATHNLLIIFPSSFPAPLVVDHHPAQLALMSPSLLPHDGTTWGGCAHTHTSRHKVEVNVDINITICGAGLTHIIVREFVPNTCRTNNQEITVTSNSK